MTFYPTNLCLEMKVMRFMPKFDNLNDKQQLSINGNINFGLL